MWVINAPTSVSLSSRWFIAIIIEAIFLGVAVWHERARQQQVLRQSSHVSFCSVEAKVGHYYTALRKPRFSKEERKIFHGEQSTVSTIKVGLKQTFIMRWESGGGKRRREPDIISIVGCLSLVPSVIDGDSGVTSKSLSSFWCMAWCK